MNAGFALRNAGLSLAFTVCRIDCNYRVFNLLLMNSTPSLTLSILVKLQGLLRIPDNLKLQSLERGVMARLVFTIFLIISQYTCPVDLLIDADMGHMSYTRGF